MNDLNHIFAALDGARIPGGCDHCDAYQVPSVDSHEILHITVKHDDWCPWLECHERRRVERKDQ